MHSTSLCDLRKMKLRLLDVKFVIWLFILYSSAVILVVAGSVQLYFTDRIDGMHIGYTCYIDTSRPSDMSMLIVGVPRIGVIETIPFCIRSDDVEEFDVSQSYDNSHHRNFTFQQLHAEQITSTQLFEWLAPIDVIERYQVYIDTFDQLMSQQIYVNCTQPWFGPSCQYVLERSVEDKTKSSLNGSCYIYIECDRGPSPLCLQWYEICDGKIDCINDGVDELYCLQLEQTECQPNEFRCRDGTQCISKDMRGDDPDSPDCQDYSDQKDLISFSNVCYLLPFNIILCTDLKCSPNLQTCGNGECVNDLNSCQNYFGLFSMHKLLSSHNLTDFCITAMSCITTNFSSLFCDDFCSYDDNSCLQIISDDCPTLFEFPTTEKIPVSTKFLYTNNYIDQVTPVFVCYEQRLFSLPPTTIQLNNYTCRFWHEFNHDHSSSISYVVQQLEAHYTLHYSATNTSYCQHSTLYLCLNSTKCISKHRLVDGIVDCVHGDDENYTNSCSLPHNQRVKCLHENKCIMHQMMFNGENDCLGGTDEPVFDNIWDRGKTVISFSNLCDGLNYLFPININGTIETDETECEDWPCNHTYTRCDGVWYCRNGADEIGCKSKFKCPPFHHSCISPTTYEIMCYNITKAGDNKIDCLGGLDERHICYQTDPTRLQNRFMCLSLNESKCLDWRSICDNINDCDDKSDELFCRLTYSRRKTVFDFLDSVRLRMRFDNPNRFLFRNFHLFPINTPVEESQRSSISPSTGIVPSSKNIDNSMLQISNTRSYIPRCNRGIHVQMRKQYNNSEYYHDVCLCSPAYFGDSCQYQSQRITVSVKINAAIELQTRFSIIILLLNQEHLIESYDFHAYLGIHECTLALVSYLLYSMRPKTQGHNYSVRIDIYENHHHLNYRGSWLFPLSFPFLPVHRVAVKLTIPPHEFFLQKSSDCQRNCIHGLCVQYINNHDDFCLCDPRWSGSDCSTPYVCNCASSATCIGFIRNRSICLCPLYTHGTRCYLKTSSCLPNPCQNNGQCIPIGEPFQKDKYYCICLGVFFGNHCQYRRIALDVHFSKDLQLPPFLSTYFTFVGDNAQHTTFNSLKKIKVYENSFTLFLPLEVSMVLINFNNQNYLTALLPRIAQAINISSTVTPSHRCHHIYELFNKTFVELHILQRLKKYHSPCQKNHELMCFYDDEFTCLCNLDRHANCFSFTPKQNIELNDYTYCEHGSTRLYDRTICPEQSMCLCPDCFHGSRCQFSTKGAGLSIDFILGYYVLPHVSIYDQPTIVKVSIGINVLLSAIGFVNAMISITVFQNKESRLIGSGQYLLTTSVTSLILMIIFLLRFWMLMFSQLSLITNETLLYIHCLSIDVILNILVSASNWFSAFIMIDRAVSVVKGANFNRKLSVKLAKRNIILILLLTSISFIYDPVHRRRITDEEEKRIWCIVQYSSIMQMINSIISACHILIPFLINIIAACMIIGAMVNIRSKSKSTPYKQQLRTQLQQFKHLLISPIILVILSLPHIVIKFLPGCMKSIRDPWLYLVGYFLLFIPPFMTTIVFIYPSTQYYELFRQTLKQISTHIHFKLRTYRP